MVLESESGLVQANPTEARHLALESYDLFIPTVKNAVHFDVEDLSPPIPEVLKPPLPEPLPLFDELHGLGVQILEPKLDPPFLDLNYGRPFVHLLNGLITAGLRNHELVLPQLLL